jgi:hypothetical protein
MASLAAVRSRSCPARRRWAWPCLPGFFWSSLTTSIDFEASSRSFSASACETPAMSGAYTAAVP